MFKRIRHRLVQYLVKNLLKAITEDDILILSGKDFLLNKRKLTQDELVSLSDDAKHLSKSLLWKLISNDLRYSASMRMAEKAVNVDDIIFGKAMLFNLDQIKIFISRLSRVK